jgi:hypothetical protein
MREIIRKKVKIYFVAVAVVLGMCSVFTVGVQARNTNVKTQCTTYSGENVENQSYIEWSSTVKSYLSYNDDGTFMRFQANAVENGYLVEYYDSEYNITNTKIISTELSLFGAFYEEGDYYYILSGQKNEDESDDVEVYRVTKYDKDWNRIDSCGLYGANTYIPFSVGSARIAAYGDYLLIRTCHEMYASSNGLNHQANVTIQVDTANMQVVDAYYSISNISAGYVSHSFNQFIQMEDGKIVAVDHGDSYPRSVVLVQYPSAVTANGFTKSGCNSTGLIAFKGLSGANYTGGTIGGFEISDTSYLVAGSLDIDFSQTYTKGRNIYVASQSKSTGEVTLNYITNYEVGTGTTDTPQFVKLADDSYLLLWHRNSSVYYTQIDGEGNQVGKIYSMEGDLSDCVPVVSQNKLVWYTWNNETVTFYEIALEDFSKTDITTIVNGHQFEYGKMDSTEHTVTRTCTVCGYSETNYVVYGFYTYWRPSTEEKGYYFQSYSSRFDVGDSVKYLIRDISVNESTDTISANEEMVVDVADKSVVSVNSTGNTTGTLTMLKTGITKVSIYPKHNPTYKKTYMFRVGKEGELSLSDCNIILFRNQYSYTGKACEPIAIVTYQGTRLEEGTDYTLTYSNNKNVGTGTVTVTGAGLFSGTKDLKFTIELTSIRKTTIESVTNADNGIKLKWSAVDNASGYIVYRKEAGTSTWVEVKTITNAGTISCVDTAVKSKNGSTYVYKIESYNTTDTKQLTSTSKEKTIVRLTAPTKVKVKNVSKQKLKISWAKNTKVGGYEIQYSTSKTFAKGNKRIKVSKSSAKKTISKLTKGKTYYIRIRSYYKADGETYYSVWSTKKSVKIKK